ncbi:MAG: hypothetical protein IKM91_01355 [Candidatus Methanomethylophilaceae archaeon]|nr:hypothetical protein [Candidatus Methanomethylophilaceae archaeon]MBR3477133.1 hypothetical protein [Candidatus Methanomethylophilaceae archaeon]MBR4216235.1 hypothetical protein [Candidatus Methanomethylophilaceae archaeon]MBR6870253.1 hypothetical protein [Candidatus Methanomethylophilaceae archaeon]
MSFFKENRTAGIALMVLGAINLIVGLVALVTALTAGNIVVSAVVACIGPIIMAALYLRFGISVKNGGVPKKIDILAYFVRLAGLSEIIIAVFNLWYAIETSGAAVAIGAVIISVIIGLIILFIAGRINDGRQDTGDKIIWIILVVLFAISAVLDVLAVIGFITDGNFAFDLKTISALIVPIASFIIDVFMLLLLFDSDVKREMNM